MNKKTTKYQIILSVTSLLLVVGIFSLPKVLVANEENSLSVKKQTKKESKDADVQEMHQAKLTAKQTEKLDSLRQLFLTSKSIVNKNAFGDSIIYFFKNINQYDSSAYYAGELARVDSSQQNLIKAGDENLFACRFFIKPDKAKKFGESARQFYQKALNNDKENLDLQAMMALTYTYPLGQDPKRMMKGVRMLKEIVETKEPTHEISLWHLASLAMFRQGYDDAIIRLKTLVEAHPENEEAQFYLADCYLKTGDKSKALELFKALQSKTQDSRIKESIEKALK